MMSGAKGQGSVCTYTMGSLTVEPVRHEGTINYKRAIYLMYEDILPFVIRLFSGVMPDLHES